MVANLFSVKRMFKQLAIMVFVSIVIGNIFFSDFKLSFQLTKTTHENKTNVELNFILFAFQKCFGLRLGTDEIESTNTKAVQ